MLADRFTGLTKHKIEVKEERPHQDKSFDFDRAFDYLRQVTVEIAEAFPSEGKGNIYEWGRAHCPLLVEKVNSTYEEVAEAFKAADRKRVLDAINAWKDASLELFKAYEKSPAQERML